MGIHLHAGNVTHLADGVDDAVDVPGGRRSLGGLADVEGGSGDGRRHWDREPELGGRNTGDGEDDESKVLHLYKRRV